MHTNGHLYADIYIYIYTSYMIYAHIYVYIYACKYMAGIQTLRERTSPRAFLYSPVPLPNGVPSPIVHAKAVRGVLGSHMASLGDF